MILLIDHLSKRFRQQEHPALDAVSFCVEAGDIVCLAGESGSGKTTLLRCIAGLEAPDSGRISVAGELLTEGPAVVPPEQRGIGLVFQDYALFPHLTVLRNVIFGLHHLPRRERRGRAREMLDLVRMSDYEGRYPHELSGGQCQRVALARAMAPQPRLLLFDEAFSSLDRQLRRAMLDSVRQLLKQTGTTAICVTHDIADALALADRLAILRQGKLLQIGTPHSIYDRPVDQYVATFFGDTNLVPAEVSPSCVTTDFGTLARPEGVNGARHAWLSIRPHDLQIKAAGEGACGTVIDVRFQGHCQELHVKLRCSQRRPYRVHVPLDESWNVGDCIHLLPEADKVRLLASQTVDEG